MLHFLITPVHSCIYVQYCWLHHETNHLIVVMHFFIFAVRYSTTLCAERMKMTLMLCATILFCLLHLSASQSELPGMLHTRVCILYHMMGTYLHYLLITGSNTQNQSAKTMLSSVGGCCSPLLTGQCSRFLRLFYQ